MTIDRAIKQFVSGYKTRNTAKTYDRILRLLAKYLRLNHGVQDVADMQAVHVQGWFQWCEKENYAHQSLLLHRAIANQWCKFLKEHQYWGEVVALRTSASMRIERRGMARARRAPEQLALVLACLDKNQSAPLHRPWHERLRLLLILARDTGVSVPTLLLLRASDFVASSRTLCLPKRKHEPTPRVHVVSVEVAKRLQKWCRSQKIFGTAPLFPGRNPAHPMTRQRAWKMLTSLCELADADLIFQDLVCPQGADVQT